MLKPKIYMVCGSYPPDEDGVGDYTAILLAHFIKIGLPVTLITSQFKEIGHSEVILAIIKKWNFSGIAKIANLVRKNRPDILHIQYPSKRYQRHIAINLLPFLMRVSLSKLKIVVTQHEFSNYSILGRLRNFLHLIFSHKYVIPEAKEIEILTKICPFLKKGIIYIPIASNINFRHPKISYSHRDHFTISFFGIIRPKKGIENLLNALSKLKNRQIELLIIAGLDLKNRYHKKIYQLIENLGLKKLVRFTGYSDEQTVSKYLLMSDLVVLPFSEGISEKSGTFLAALAHHLPVITTIGKHLPVGLKDEINVKLIKPDNTEELIKAVERLMDNEELRKKIAREGYEWSRKYSWSKVVEEHLILYKTLVS